MKTFLLSISLMLFSTMGMAQQPNQLCTDVSNLVGFIASARDADLPPQSTLQFLVGKGMPADVAYQYVSAVYFVLKDSSKDELKEKYYDVCMKTNA